MMNTQLLLKWKPNSGLTDEPWSNLTRDFVPVNDNLLQYPTALNEYAVRSKGNPNYPVDINSQQILGIRRDLIAIDLYEDLDLPLNFTIMDIREPDKRKTNFSKTIRIPGTKSNRKIFNHVYEISGNSKFNPNIRTEVIILQDGVQVIRGNMQLRDIFTFDDRIEFEISITGDFTSLFSDLGSAKLSDIDFSEYNHKWSRDNIYSSWIGTIKKDGYNWSKSTLTDARTIDSFSREESTGRVIITTTTDHSYLEGDWVRVNPTTTTDGWEYIYGEWQVAEVLSTTEITINHPFTNGLWGNTLDGIIHKITYSGKGYVYPMVSWGDDSIPSTTNIPEFPVSSWTIGVHVKDIWDKIFERTGSKYESDFLNSQFFKRLILVQKKTQYELKQEEFESRKFKVANDTPYYLQVAGFGVNSTGQYNGIRNYRDNSTTIKPYQFNTDITSSGGFLYNGIEGTRPYDYSTHKWIVTNSGVYAFEFSMRIRLEAIISNYTAAGVYKPPVDDQYHRYVFGGYPRYPREEDVFIIAKLIKETNGLRTVLESIRMPLASTTGNGDYLQPNKPTFTNWRFPTKDILFKREGELLNRDDKLWIEVSYEAVLDMANKGIFTEYIDNGIDQTTTAYRGRLNVELIGPQYFSNTPSKFISEGSTIEVSKMLPNDILAKDFLISIIRMFNLHFESDADVEKSYYIEPRDDFYRDGSGGVTDYIDWSDKCDWSSIQITPMGELTAKYYSFAFRDDNDYWNKRYRDEQGISYGNYTKEIQNDFLTNEQKISLSFGSTVMINTPEDSDIVIGQVVQKDLNNLNKPINTSAKILIWGGIRPTRGELEPKKWHLKRTQDVTNYNPELDKFTYYPYAGTVDSPYDPLWDINWYYTEYVYWNRARWSSENLYNKYWSGFIREISDSDSKLIKAYVRLDAKDINELDFKKIYVINGHYLRLQKIIDYNANGEDLTQCEFLKLRAPSKFKRVSVGPDVGFEDGYVNIGNPTRVISKPPSNYNGRFPTNNYSASSLSSQYNPNISGQNNLIGSRSNNVSIMGDENSIGSGTNNVSITGNGVYIGSGLRNITVIGTNNIVINESDVAYINGVRYKNGMPVSRASVIDAGLNTVSKRTSINTNITVIDACEDITVNYNTQTHETIIEAGSECILPDLPTYGVSTQNSPLPTSNYIGPLVREVEAINLPELIIRRVNPRPYRD